MHLKILRDELKRDFPGIKNKDIGVYYYAGERYKRTYGLEITHDRNVYNAEYQEIDSVEKTM